MTALAKGNEPSMEEILASIRRIIADDPQVVVASPEAETAPAAPAMPQPDDVLDLAVAATPVPQDSEDDPKSQDDVDLMFADTAPEPAPAPAPPPMMVAATPPSPPVVVPEPRSELLSAATSASIAGAFSSLSNTLLTGNARTLEDLVKDMMKPMLKTWLDDNLPSIVERLVKAEIERVARGGR